ncbi:inositol hexakisphosphate and diphosphoinositol-pentakisphosphate kinase-like isoform X4 [Amphibalanus amphitrite]|uniref:inositol hexakisphosphate and diphosphoinositol-pentakisphosphate kinase-like isoform X4 n=1 Tax=Amphibalanus amphitrite TaxID=1232801 RepID=UPI001C90F40D|nr:inositol hexakisphosphate and diphosphoinositol-pentakisphosphate kinase-like isoform X4 [Amphibalanus amphitrite]
MRSRGDGPAAAAWQEGSGHPLLAGYMDMVRLFCALCKDHHALEFQHGDGDHWHDWTTIYRRADAIPDDYDDEGKQVVVGICAMEKKSGSRPMKEILTRLEEFEYIKCLIFPEHVILKEPVENWPLCDCLISFHSKGFPLEKAIQYSQLRKPFIINNLQMQYTLQDRRMVYRLLEREGIDLPRFAILDRDAPDFVEERDFLESDDVVEINGITFNKPFVEKPVSAEDHNIYIYYPSSAGGGSQRLFRKIGSRSSVYSPESRLRRTGSYIYENFMPTDGTDVKVYTVGPEYAHAEARKSPALDGKVERDQDGKEVRYPVILTNNEKLIARKVCQAFKQTVCGFDLLRANGRSYVCDVNGFSFVKNSNKYYDDSAKILGNMVLRELAPTLHIPWSVPFQLDDPPIVPTTFGKMMELRCAIAVIRHGDRTPKQKMKMEIRHEKFFAIFHKYDGGQQGHIKLKKPKQLQEILDVARELLEVSPDHPEVAKKRAKLEQLRNVLEMYGHFSGINRKIQLKYQPKGWKRSSETETSDDPSLVLVLKWGGELTPAGRVQAEELGKIFRCMYPGGQGEYAGTQGLGLLRLHSTYRHDLKIYASDEGRVQMTAAAFAKGLLALEGELTPILVQMVKSADTNGLLDNDSDSRNLLNMVKSRIHDLFQQDRDFTEDDIHQLNPTGSISVAKALSRLKNPVETCELVYSHLQKLLAVITPKMEESKELILYHGESWELMLRRWVKLEKDFKTANGKFDISKIPDIYDNIKYDLQHNQKVLQFDDAEEMYRVAKTVADVIVPQEYGLTRQEKLSIGHGICTPLLKKIQADLRRNIDEGAEENVNRLNPMYSRGVSSPQRHVRTRLYFTSESHLHSLLTMLRYGGLADEGRDEQWRRAMEYCSAVSELNYMSQVVIMLYEDPTKDPLSENRFHVELHFSPGVNCCVQKNPPQGPGFRPQSRGDMHKPTNAAVRRPPSMIEEEAEPADSGSEPDKHSDYQSSSSRTSWLPQSQPINISRVATSPAHLSPPHQDLLRSCSHPGSPDRKGAGTGAEERPRSLEGLMERGITEPPPAVRPADGVSEQDDDDEELRRQRHSVPSQTQYAHQLSILNQQLQLGAPGGSASSLFSTAVISGSSSAPELKSLFTPVTAIGIEGCGGVPSIRPLETLHNAMSLRQVNAFIDRVTSMEFRAPPPAAAADQPDRPPPLGLHSPTHSLSISGPSSFVSSPGSTTPLDGARAVSDGW